MMVFFAYFIFFNLYFFIGNIFSFFPFSHGKNSVKPEVENVIDNFQYRGVHLGMSYDEVLSHLQTDDFLQIDRNDFLWKENISYFSLYCKAPPFIEAVYYQFEPDTGKQVSNNNNNLQKSDENQEKWKLYSIRIVFNEALYVFSEVYKVLKQHYGQPNERKPFYAIWNEQGNKGSNSSGNKESNVSNNSSGNDETILVLEYPTTVKLYQHSNVQRVKEEEISTNFLKQQALDGLVEGQKKMH